MHIKLIEELEVRRVIIFLYVCGKIYTIRNVPFKPFFSIQITDLKYICIIVVAVITTVHLQTELPYPGTNNPILSPPPALCCLVAKSCPTLLQPHGL